MKKRKLNSKNPKYYPSPVDVVKESDGLTVNKLIPCKENTAVLFNGNILHAATYPKNIKRRIVLNIDFTGTPHGNT